MRTLYVGGRVFTAEPETPWAESVVTERELIVAEGTLAECEVAAGANAERIDVGQRAPEGFNWSGYAGATLAFGHALLSARVRRTVVGGRTVHVR